MPIHLGVKVRATKENGKVLLQYVKLARKLGKLPSIKDSIRHGLSERQIYNEFESMRQLQDLALKTHPEIRDTIIPSKLGFDEVEMFRFKQEKGKAAKANAALITKVNTLEYLSKFAENVFADKQITPVKPRKSTGKIKRAQTLVLSDLHFGADITAEETGYLDYGRVEEARRFAYLIQQTIDYKPHYRKETELHVALLGDIIQHKLHDAQAAAPVSEQICRAIHLLSQGIAQLAENFGKISVQCATGNHGRDLNRHQERASSGKWDSVETVIYYSLKKILSKYKNVEFNIPKSPYNVYSVLGHKMFATHGDTVLKPGNPGKSLNIKGLEDQINRFNASLRDQEEISVAIVGHTHCSSVSNLNTGAIMVTNGSLPPTDDYAVSIGFLENRASQTLFETTEEHAVGDIRFIRVGSKQDKDASLDSIIKPYGGFND